MADLSRMILGETARTQDLIDRPATLLRRGEEERQADIAAADKLKTARLGRKLAKKQDERAETEEERKDKRMNIAERDALRREEQSDRLEMQEERAKELHPLLVEQTKANIDILKNKAFMGAQETAQKYAAPVVEQGVEFWKLYLQNGDPAMRDQAIKIAENVANNPALNAYVAMTPQYSEFASITDAHLYDPNQSREQLDADLNRMFKGLEQSGNVYRTWQQDAATRAAAQAMTMARQQAEARTEGEIRGTVKGMQFAEQQGVDLAEDEGLSEGQQARVQKTYSNFLANTLFPEIGENAGKLWFNKNLDKDGKFSKAVSDMPAEMFTAESPQFTAFFQIINSDAFKGKTDADKNKAIDRILESDTFAMTSPFRAKLKELKKPSLKNLRDAESIKPVVTVPNI